MAKRENTFLLKRSNIPGKIPLPGDLNLGEIALNTADVILYASGTTTNQILPIGWDRLSILSGGTVNGNISSTGYFSGNTYYGDGSNLTGINDFYVTGGTYTGGSLTLNRQNGSVTITGFTNQTSLSATSLYVDYIDFNTGATVTTQFGRINWDSGTGTLNIGIGDSTTGLVDFQVGQEEVVRVFNSEATTLQKGEIVYVSGSQGNRPAVKRAQAQGDLYSVTTLGMVDLAIPSGSQGYVTTFGIISNLNTIGFTGGTPIWLSPTTPGGYTTTKPQAPDHTVLIGYVVRVHASVGSIFVNISNGWEINELHDVRINGVSEGDLLMRSSYSGSPVWVNSKTLNGSYTITGNTSIGGNLTVTGNTRLTTLTASTIGASGNCVNDIYVSNIHSCSPLNINPLNEGNVYFGSISAVTVDLTNQQLGVGTTAPIAKLHISDTGVTVNPSLYTSDYVVVSAQDTAPGFNIISAGGSSGNRGVFKATRSRGTLNSPTIPSNNDNVFSLLGAIYDGVTNYSTAAINMDVDGVVTTGVTPQRIVFSTGTGSTRSERMRITSSGNVGIGLTPTVPLHVRSTAIPSTGENILQLEVGDSTGAYAAINNSTSTDGQFVPQFFGRQSSSSNQTATIFGGVIDSTQDSGTTPVTLFRSFLSSLSVVATRPVFQFRNWTTNLLTILSNGNLGIGTDTPTEKLEVNGKTKTTTFQMTTSPVNGYVLTSDASGNGTWQANGNGTVTSIATSSPITGGTITSSGTIGIQDAAADGATKGAASFTASDFNSASGVISLDYLNGQSANGTTKGFLTATDWSTFNSKQNAITLTTTGTSGVATFIGSTLNIPNYATGLSFFTEATNTTAPNTTIPVNSLTATGAATNIDVAIVPKGNGAFTLAIADNTSTGGNKRGTRAVDLQLNRTLVTAVASGTDSFVAGVNSIANTTQAIAIGTSCVASGQESMALGSNSITFGLYSFAAVRGAIAGGQSSIAIGESVTASDTTSIAIGNNSQSTARSAVAIGESNIADANYSSAQGNFAHTFGIIGRQAYASGQESTAGDSQTSKFVLHERTTGNTATTLTTNSATPSTNNQVILSNQSAYRFKGSIIGKQSGSTSVCAWDIDGVIVRGANAAATTLLVNNVNVVTNIPAWGTPTLAADTTNGGLRVQVTGAAATNIQWTAMIETTEVIYA